jgi:hypothetical protein
MFLAVIMMVPVAAKAERLGGFDKEMGPVIGIDLGTT